jgi:hypothetical protein
MAATAAPAAATGDAATDAASVDAEDARAAPTVPRLASAVPVGLPPLVALFLPRSVPGFRSALPQIVARPCWGTGAPIPLRATPFVAALTSRVTWPMGAAMRIAPFPARMRPLGEAGVAPPCPVPAAG